MNAKQLIRNQAGMTLIEIVIVLAIIVGIVSIFSGELFSTFSKSRIQTLKIQFSEIGKALDRYNLDCNSYPTTEEGLTALVEPSAKCKNWGPTPYMKKALLQDPWNNEIIYERKSSTDYVLISLGADGNEGGEGLDADVRSDAGDE
jgi:general secretion pathway protein G